MHGFSCVLQLASKFVEMFSKFVEQGTYTEVSKNENCIPAISLT